VRPDRVRPAAPALAAPLALVQRALAGRDAWLVGGLVRDRAMACRGIARPAPPAITLYDETLDLDLVVADDPGRIARALAQAAGAASFPLSKELGYWRVVAAERSWQIDVEPLRGARVEDDLRRRDFTVNAIAQSPDGARTLDPLGGLADLDRRTLRMAGERAFTDDPLRVLRLVRQAVDLGLEPDERTLARARACAHALRAVSPERIFGELKLILAGAEPVRGLELMRRVGAREVVLPQVEALGGVMQSSFHHRDVLGHTLEVLGQAAALTGSEPALAAAPAPAAAGRMAADARTVLAEPLADGLTHAGALRFGALLHDVGKPLTRAHRADGAVSFVGHDEVGEALARELLRRLRTSERLRAHVAALVRHHLRLGFLVHEHQPLARRTAYAYLRACGPVAVDVTLLSVADRLATRGERSEPAIAAHVELARAMLADALRWRADGGPPRPLWRGDELAAALGIAPGPALGELLEALRAAQFAGEVKDREQALEYARGVRAHSLTP
jgi:poly(A) polymerase